MPEPSTPRARTASHTFAGGDVAGSWREAERRDHDRGAGELADRHLQRRDRAHRQAGEEHGGRVTERDAEHRERRDEIAATLDADEQGDADEADADADQPRPGDALGDVHPRGEDDGEDRRRRLDHRCQARVEVRLGEAEQPEGHGVVERAEHDDRPEVAAQRGEAAASREHRRGAGAASAPEDEPPEGDDRRLERLDAELDEQERGSPDRGEEQQEGGVAAGHGFVTVIAAGASPCEVPSRRT